MMDRNEKITLSGRIPSLDGLRGVAILMVILGHGLQFFSPSSSAVLQFFGNSKLGVTIFFVLSGFLIYNLSVREIRSAGVFQWKQFCIRRALRIFPCFYFYIIVVMALMAFGVIELPSSLIGAAATFSLNYYHLWSHATDAFHYVVIGHYWTLALEEQFYLTWPFLFVLFRRGKLLPVLLAFIYLAPIIRVASYFLAPESRGQIGMMFHTGFDSIAAGVVLGELLQNNKWSERLYILASNRIITSGLLIFLFVVSPLLSKQFRGAYDLAIGKTLELMAVCIIITAAILFKGTTLYRFLNWRPLAYVGVLSYSLYVWNNLFLLGDLPWVGQFPYNFLCVLIMGLFSHYLIEKPFLKLKDRFHRPAATLQRAEQGAKY